MIEKDDWRLRGDVEYLKNKEINPTDGEEITQYAIIILRNCLIRKNWMDMILNGRKEMLKDDL